MDRRPRTAVEQNPGWARVRRNHREAHVRSRRHRAIYTTSIGISSRRIQSSPVQVCQRRRRKIRFQTSFPRPTVGRAGTVRLPPPGTHLRPGRVDDVLHASSEECGDRGSVPRLLGSGGVGGTTRVPWAQLTSAGLGVKAVATIRTTPRRLRRQVQVALPHRLPVRIGAALEELAALLHRHGAQCQRRRRMRNRRVGAG